MVSNLSNFHIQLYESLPLTYTSKLSSHSDRQELNLVMGYKFGHMLFNQRQHNSLELKSQLKIAILLKCLS